MVKRRNALSRAAFTMIELIFAIVVISIAVLSLPMMIQTTSRGIEQNIVQEAIFAASAELMGATSYYWDNRSIEEIAFSRLSRVVDVDGDCNATTRLRDGHINQPFHRRCLDSTDGTGVNYTTAEATLPSLNMSVHAVVGFDSEDAEAAGYKQEYKSQIGIAKGNIDAAINDNIKVLTASVYEDDGATLLTRLRIYSANIGEIDYYKRRF